VFLDIAWIREKLPDAADRIRRKLPSMYHQFKQLADIDITAEPMEVGPTTHYIMGGVRVDAETQMSTLPGLYAAGECAAGLHGANRLGGNSLSDLLVFGKRAGEHAAAFAREHGRGAVDRDQVAEGLRRALEPFERAATGAAAGAAAAGTAAAGTPAAGTATGGENPFTTQAELQELMQDLVGIVRSEEEMQRALAGIQRLQQRAAVVRVDGNRAFNPGWHTALDLGHLLTVSEAITRAALQRKESRGAHFREDCPAKVDAFAKVNHVVRKDGDGRMTVVAEPVPALRPELQQVITEMK
jgi:succinate dehydrogenase / fumarate reductase flavoprotein subunit